MEPGNQFISMDLEDITRYCAIADASGYEYITEKNPKTMAWVVSITGKKKQYIDFNDKTDSELAMALDDFMAAASLRWDDFTDYEKSFLEALKEEVCRRFIAQHFEGGSRHSIDEEALKIPPQLSDRAKQEFEFDEEVKAKLHDVCTYMWEYGLKQISMGYSSGARFRLRMEFEEGSR